MALAMTLVIQLGVVTTSNKRAEKVSDMTGNPRKHVEVSPTSLPALSSQSCR